VLRTLPLGLLDARTVASADRPPRRSGRQRERDLQ